ncbi:MAG TPA: M1 family metallopeptidase [Planctomycetota bacterium]|jgi:hypothetical protein|nr:hypothetical protein [Planctomycetota bacterium]MDP7246628.1 M1 family metallopeptidase [Planctomycetota bacterium]HJM40008.1 M1 family metallopeptidase [Planctomycetota bacterium]|tara:strand:+ start:25979 stop:28234 length:2256 start_codon:yes stop_codon:yes gene_type:complete
MVPRRIVLACFYVLSALPAFAQLPEQSPKVVDYTIAAHLQADGRTIKGELSLDWKNTTTQPTQELHWHVYNNAWKSRDSLFMQEAHRFGVNRSPREWGGTQIKEVTLKDGTPLEFSYQPQSGAPKDETVLITKLPKEVQPGETVSVELSFNAVLPPAFVRSGVDGDGGYIHAVQWYPKVGVFEELEGMIQWNCEPYHYLTEFYADYGSYTLDLTLPIRYAGKVAATGSLTSEVSSETTVQYVFQSDNVHDFAWTADPDFEVIEISFHTLMNEGGWRDHEEEERIFNALSGDNRFAHIQSVETLLPRDTLIRLMLQPEHAEYSDRYLDATAKSLYWFGLWYGEYPYETISVIDPAHNARRTGGMEYPRLFTGGVRKGNAQRTLSPEGVTVHEFGHQFWYGLVGNDEFRHAWMDEGFNTFSTQRVKAKGWAPSLATWSVLGNQYYGQAPVAYPSYGKGSWLSLFALQRWETPDLGFVGELSYELRRNTSIERWARELPLASYLPEVWDDPVLRLRGSHAYDWSDPLAKPTYTLQNSTMRRTNAYNRPAMMLETFSRLMGEETWTRAIRAYHERYRYQHPRPKDFFKTVQEFAAGVTIGDQELNWGELWKQAYQSNDTLDYGVHRLQNQVSILNSKQLEQEDTEEDHEGPWDVVIELRRLGTFQVPVEVRVTWEDQSEENFVWDGRDSWKRFEWPVHSLRATKVEVDPNQRLLLDRNWMNNSRLDKPDDKRALQYGLRAMIWAQQVLHYSGGMG